MNVTEIEEAYSDEAFIEKSNVAPVLVVKPKDVAIWAGEELVIDFSTAWDLDGDGVAYTLDMGRASSFAEYDMFNK